MIRKKKSSASPRVTNIKYMAALEDRDLPPLTLDNKWHQLFNTVHTTPRIEHLSEELNVLIKKQGQLYNDMKDVRSIKQKLMDTILKDMSVEDESRDMDRLMSERGRLVDECTDKLEEYQREYREIPEKIKEINYQLMLETMELCRRQIYENTREIEEIEVWVEQTRAELKKQLVIKEEDITINNNLYTYMHDIFGSKVMEIFDIEYDKYENKVKINDKK